MSNIEVTMTRWHEVDPTYIYSQRSATEKLDVEQGLDELLVIILPDQFSCESRGRSLNRGTMGMKFHFTVSERGLSVLRQLGSATGTRALIMNSHAGRSRWRTWLNFLILFVPKSHTLQWVCHGKRRRISELLTQESLGSNGIFILNHYLWLSAWAPTRRTVNVGVDTNNRPAPRNAEQLDDDGLSVPLCLQDNLIFMCLQSLYHFYCWIFLSLRRANTWLFLAKRMVGIMLAL